MFCEGRAGGPACVPDRCLGRFRRGWRHSAGTHLSGVGQAARALVVGLVADPDAPDPAAPRMTWVHWVVFNLPGESVGLAQPLPTAAREGLNDWHTPGFRGPCPPVGRHRYVHKVYALDVALPDLKRAEKASVEKAMAGHILGYGELVGTYQKE